MAEPPVVVDAAGTPVTVTNPGKVFFPAAGYTKLDVVRYYLAVAEGALRGVRDRPMVLKRFVNGIDAEPFFQKRAPANLPPFVRTAHVAFPSGRTADLCVIDSPAGLAWVSNLGCLDLNPWPVRADDVDHPDELRIDLDPTPQASWAMVREVAMVCRDVLHDHAMLGYPKTSGSRGIHINIRIERRWGFRDVRRCALALGREVERRVPELATTKWWKEERHGVFIDYNQNARDRTVASAYSIRPTPDARVSAPLAWDEVPAVDPAAFTLATMPGRYAALGDPGSGIEGTSYSLEPLLDLVARQERDGLGEAPLPPHYPREEGEPVRAQPSRRRRS